MKFLQNYTIIQKPNFPLIVGLVSKLLSLPKTPLSHVLSLIATVAFIGWAVEEIHLGENWFRRSLGAIVLTAIFLRLLALNNS